MKAEGRVKRALASLLPVLSPLGSATSSPGRLSRPLAPPAVCHSTLSCPGSEGGMRPLCLPSEDWTLGRVPGQLGACVLKCVPSSHCLQSVRFDYSYPSSSLA